MKNYRIKLPLIDHDEDFASLAYELGGELTNPHLLQVSGRIAKGTVRRFQFEPAFSLRAWNLLFQNPVEFYKPPIPSADNSFSIIYVLTPEYCQVKTIGEHRQFNATGQRTTLFIADCIQLDFEAQPFHPVQIIDMNVSAFWLAQQFQKTGLPLEALWERFSKKDTPIVMVEPHAASVTLAVNQLFDLALGTDGKDLSYMKAGAASLITSFLDRNLQQQHRDIQANQDVHFDKVMEVEAILQAHLQKNLPNVGTIAHQVALSESTLKRHFKVIFGKSVYEYYLQKKMELAKHLLLEKPLSVNEAAEILGYEKASNFIEIFKKHHGFSPGSIKRKGFG